MKIFKLIAFSILLVGFCATTSAEEDLGYQGKGTDNEQSVTELLNRLKASPSVEFRIQNGWKIAAVESGRVLYSFTPDDHPAHPSYVKREVVERDGAIYIHTSASCGAKKSVCDQLVKDFIDLNNKIKDHVQGDGA